MFALLTSIRNRDSHRRTPKTPGELYRILSADFLRLKDSGCSCRMPMLFERDREGAQDANWGVEPLWYGCIECQALARRVCEAHQALYELRGPAREAA